MKLAYLSAIAVAMVFTNRMVNAEDITLHYAGSVDNEAIAYGSCIPAQKGDTYLESVTFPVNSKCTVFVDNECKEQSPQSAQPVPAGMTTEISHTGSGICEIEA